MEADLKPINPRSYPESEEVSIGHSSNIQKIYSGGRQLMADTEYYLRKIADSLEKIARALEQIARNTN